MRRTHNHTLHGWPPNSQVIMMGTAKQQRNVVASNMIRDNVRADVVLYDEVVKLGEPYVIEVFEEIGGDEIQHDNVSLQFDTQEKAERFIYDILPDEDCFNVSIDEKLNRLQSSLNWVSSQAMRTHGKAMTGDNSLATESDSGIHVEYNETIHSWRFYTRIDGEKNTISRLDSFQEADAFLDGMNACVLRMNA